jgi:murein DD-endopeptidase MepM/ murein hydrolase activator NlpD
MNKHPLIVTVGVIIIGIALAVFHKQSVTPAPVPSPTPTASASPSPTTPAPSATPSPTASPVALYSRPIADFTTRITKKKFGTYVTPANSPVQPERFTGYHTGVDVEYADVTDDVPVYAIADGVVQQAGWVSGYGGLLVIKISSTGNYILYGHLRSSSLPAAGTRVKKADQVGLLGTAFGQETDGERRHLHFAVYIGNPVDIKGYVQNQADLSSWKDPLTFF